MSDVELAVTRRADGTWVVILARGGAAPMEFTCESEDQARAFAQSLGSQRRSSRELAASREAQRPARSSGWWARIRTG